MGSNLIFVTITLVYADKKRIGTTNQGQLQNKENSLKVMNIDYQDALALDIGMA